ncbi:hypothetical protein EIK77_000034 [Talaromyces pinophilus]|nr:hypothetical protein EIK77_000034 [Talaromyces pinophilus]
MHADTRTFLKYYLQREVNVDLAGEMRKQDPQQRGLVAPQEDIMRAACRMSRSIDPNRPIELTTAQASSVNELPEIQEIIRQRDEVSRRLGRPMSQHKGTPDYKLHQKLTAQLSSMRQKAKAELLKKIQYDYDQEQPMRELQLQLELAALNLPEEEFQQRLQSARSKFSNTVNRSLEGSHELPLPLKRFAEAVFTLPKPTLKEEMLRRTEAMDAGAAVCRFEEGETSRIAHNKRRRTENAVDDTAEHNKRRRTEETVDDTTEHGTSSDNRHTASESKLQEAIRSVMNDTRPKYCFICVGNPNLDIEKRTQKFYEHGDVTKHIRRKHLKNMTVIESPTCRIHSETFPHAQAFQRHAIDTHSTVT